MKDNVATFNGRMGTGIFSFNIDRHRGTAFQVDVKNAQCEIDGGMEPVCFPVLSHVERLLAICLTCCS